MKVLHAIPDYSIAGAGKYLLTLLKRPEYTSKVHPVVCCPEGPLAEAVRALGFDVRQLPGRDRSLHLPSFSRMVGIIRAERPDLVHTHASLSARLAARMSGVPVVFTKHTPDPIGGSTGSKLRAGLQRALSDGVIAVSEYVASLLKQQGYPEDRIEVIYNGVDPSEFKLASRTSQPPKIGNVGRLTPEKGQEYLVRAAAVVVKQYPQCKFFIAGAGPEETRLRRLISQLELEDSVELTGYVSDISSFLQGLNIFAFPSIEEGLGIALIEAMVSGLPVVATRVGGIPEVVQHGVTGKLVEPADPLSLAAAILELISNPGEAATYAGNGRDWAIRSFHAADMASKTVRFYQQILERRG
ncbi:MAG TPA: glycosyltransferase [Firmicutes bacterium]|nr:glycosyltransferase [Bacillota bacterium]